MTSRRSSASRQRAVRPSSDGGSVAMTFYPASYFCGRLGGARSFRFQIHSSAGPSRPSRRPCRRMKTHSLDSMHIHSSPPVESTGDIHVVTQPARSAQWPERRLKFQWLREPRWQLDRFLARITGLQNLGISVFVTMGREKPTIRRCCSSVGKGTV